MTVASSKRLPGQAWEMKESGGWGPAVLGLWHNPGVTLTAKTQHLINGAGPDEGWTPSLGSSGNHVGRAGDMCTWERARPWMKSTVPFPALIYCSTHLAQSHSDSHSDSRSKIGFPSPRLCFVNSVAQAVFHDQASCFYWMVFYPPLPVTDADISKFSNSTVKTCSPWDTFSSQLLLALPLNFWMDERVAELSMLSYPKTVLT